MGPGGLNFRVRDGNGCDPVDKITGKLFPISIPVFKSSDLGFEIAEGFDNRIVVLSSLASCASATCMLE